MNEEDTCTIGTTTNGTDHCGAFETLSRLVVCLSAEPKQQNKQSAAMKKEDTSACTTPTSSSSSSTITEHFGAFGKLTHEVEELHQHTVLPVADEMGHQLQYNHEKEEVKPKKRKKRSLFLSAIECFKYLYSVGLLVFSVVLVMAAIFSEQTKSTGEDGSIHPVLAFFLFWFLICWLAMMEGGQGALVGLQPIDKALYADTHPLAFKNTTLAHSGDNMERFIVGRQLLVVLVVFFTNLLASAVADADVLGLNDIMTEIFLTSGVALILCTIMLGQLTSQVNSANCMLDFINNYFMLFTVNVSLALEFSGILHSVYLVQILFAKISGKPVQSSEPPRTGAKKLFFWIRVAVSVATLAYAFAVTLTALFQKQTTMYEGVPEVVSVVILFLLMACVGMMEGMQIALFAVVNLPEEELAHHHIAHNNCKLVFRDQNLQAFLIGRQICVTICMFIVARITSVDVDTDDDESNNIFGVSDGVQNFFNTGLLGAIITTIVASLIWRIVASSFPVLFLSNPLVYLIIRVCLLLEASGVCSASWLLALLHKKILRFEVDEKFIGTPEGRAAAAAKSDIL